MKKFTVLILICLLIISLLFCGCTEESSDYIINSGDAIKVGVIIPPMEEESDIGESAFAGINYAENLASQINLDKEYKIAPLVYYTDSDIEATVSQLLSEKVCAVICEGTDKDTTDAIIEAFTGSETPLVFIDCYSDSVINYENAFSISVSYSHQASAVVSYLAGKSYSTGAVVCSADDDYNKNFAKIFENTFTSNGGKSVSKYYYSGEEKNFNAKTIAGAQPEFVFVIGNVTDSTQIYSELMTAGVTAPIIFSEVFDKTLLENSEYNGVSFISKLEPDDGNYIGTDFINTYSETYAVNESDITSSIAYGYDAYMLVYDALLAQGADTQSPIFSGTVTTEDSEAEDNTDIYVSEITQSLRNITHMGVTDTISFNEQGMASATFLYVDQIENSQAVMLNRYNYNNEQN